MAKKILKKAQYGIHTKKIIDPKKIPVEKKPVDTRSTNEKLGITRPDRTKPEIPKNKPADSPIRRFKKGGSIKKK